MSGKRGLEDKLSKLADEVSVFEDGWRRIGRQGARSVCAAFVTEIDETLFSSLLRMRNAEGEILQLEAGNRRLSRFVPPAPPRLSAHQALFEGPLADPDPETLQRIAEMIHEHAGDSPYLWVESAPLSSGDSFAQIGVSAAALSEAWAEFEDAIGVSAPAAGFDGFVAGLAPLAEVWVRLEDGAVTEGTAASEIPEGLEGVGDKEWQGFLSAGSGSASAGDRPALCVLGTEAGSRGRLVLAVEGKSCVIARVPEASQGELARLWRTAGL